MRKDKTTEMLALKKAHEKKSIDILVAYRQTFLSEAGQKVLADLDKRYNMRSSFNENPHLTSFHEGERNVLLQILAALKIDENQIQERVKNVTLD